MNVNIPLCILNTLIKWHDKLFAFVRYMGRYTVTTVCSGAREGSAISPLILSLYINNLISLLKSEGYSCYLGHVYVSCLLFIDDIFLYYLHL